MEINIRKAIAELKKMTAGQLRGKYIKLFGERSRSGNKQWLFRRCAWRIQALAEGGLSERAQHRAKELARDVDIRLRPPGEVVGLTLSRHADIKQPARDYIHRNRDSRLPMPGTKLTRKYKGHTYAVEVLDNAFDLIEVIAEAIWKDNK